MTGSWYGIRLRLPEVSLKNMFGLFQAARRYRVRRMNRKRADGSGGIALMNDLFDRFR